MAITPYSTPLKTEYKPLGLEAFAKPLSEMQAKYDTTEAELDASDFALSRLTQDDDRAKEVLEQFRVDRDKLAENLVATADYKGASRNLSKLNKKFAKDLEVNAIKGNYETYQAAKKDQLERVKSGKISQFDYDVWDFNTRHRFKGTGFDPATENYSSINTHPLSDNVEDEMRKETLQLAGMAPEQRFTYLKSLGMSDAFTEEELKEVVSVRDLNQVSGEIERFLRTSKKYNQFVKERADEEYYYYNAKDSKFKDRVIGGSYDQLQGEINQYQEAANNKQLPENQRQQAGQMLKEKQAAMNNFQRNFAEAQNQGTVDEFAQMLYQKNADKTFGRLGYTGSDIVDKRSVDKYKTENVDQVAKDNADKAIKLLDEIGRVSTNSVESTAKKAELTLTGTATSSVSEFVINNKKAALETLNSIPVQKVPGMEDIDKRLSLLPKGNFKNNFSETAGTNRDLYGSLIRMNNFEEAVVDKDAQIKTLKSKLASAKNAEEKTMYSRELVALAEDKEEIRLALADDTKTLENLVKIEMNKGAVDPELKALYEQTFVKGDTQGFVRGLRTEVQNYVNRQSIEIGSTGKEVKKNAFVNFADNVMRNYRANIQTPFYAVGQEVILNASSDKFTDNKTKDLREYVLENSRGQSKVARVEFNVLNGTSKEIGGNTFDLSAYHATPHWVGNDQKGHTIMRYVLKPEYDPATKKSNGPIASYIKKQKGLPEDSPIPPTPAEIKAWNDANPTNLYVAVKGTSINPAKSAEANYIKIGDAGIAYNNPDVVVKNLQNYAPLHILQDNDRREAYFNMAARLQDAVENNYVGTELVQAPAAWKNNQDGTYTGYSITYKVVQGQVMAMVNEGTLGTNLEVNWKPEPIASVQLSSMGQNLTTALASMDLMYGTGREEDLVQVQRGWGQVPFVPAFENPGVAKIPGSNSPTTYRASY
jgi:hypothetical protein